MEILRRETDYALRALVVLAQEDGLHSTRQIAEACHISLDHTRKIMPRLAKVGIVEAVRGARGGFRLARDPEKIRLDQVIKAIQGRLVVNRCMKGRRHCGRYDTCDIAGWVERFQDGVDRMTHDVTLKNLTEEGVKGAETE